MASEHEGGLEARLARLEERIARLEAAVGSARQASPESPPVEPATAVSWPMPPPLPSPVPKPAAPRPPLFATSLADLEQRLAGRALAVVGGIALILGAIFFLSLAFSRGWIGPELRVVIGLVAGSGGLAAGAAFLDRRNRLLGHLLVPVGLA